MTAEEFQVRQQTTASRYWTLFKHAPDGILIADTDSRFLDANASICRMLGYSRDELAGMQAAGIVAPGEKCLASGCNGYIKKPINPETFVAEIERFLSPVHSQAKPCPAS